MHSVSTGAIRPSTGTGCPTTSGRTCHAHRPFLAAQWTFPRVCTATRCSTRTDTERLLDSFWEARGVFDAEQRARLVKAASDIPQLGDRPLDSSGPLPGVPATWGLDRGNEEVVEVSRRLVQLQDLLGGGSSSSSRHTGADITRMVIRQPALLTADYTELMRRLIDMKVLAAGSDIDVVGVVERQPSLLLSDNWVLELQEEQQQQGQQKQQQQEEHAAPATAGSLQADASGGGRVSGLQKVVQAWEFGLPSDGQEEWEGRYRQLVQYKERHGDPHCGFRDGDDLELTRWANKQRADERRGELDPHRRERLQQLGFEFQEDEAEFQRWFAELAAFKATANHCNPNPLATGADLYLQHWCSVQRIALRSKVLSSRREQQLTDLGFDWSGADPLS